MILVCCSRGGLRIDFDRRKIRGLPSFVLLLLLLLLLLLRLVLWKRFGLERVTRGSLLPLQEGFGVHIHYAEEYVQLHRVHGLRSMSRRDFFEGTRGEGRRGRER